MLGKVGAFILTNPSTLHGLNRNVGLISKFGRLSTMTSMSLQSSIPFTSLSALAVAISYADRSNLSTAIIPMANQFHWDSFFSGIVLSAFWVGYALTQVVGGRLSDKIGGEKVLPFSLIAWSVCTALTPVAAAFGSIPLLLIRVLLGAGEGSALPAIHSMTRTYVDATQRSISTAVITGACYVGALAANLIAPVIIDKQGWESCFWYFAALPPVIWLPLWLAFLAAYRQHQSSSSAISQNTPESQMSLLSPISDTDMEDINTTNSITKSINNNNPTVITNDVSEVATTEGPVATLRQLLSCAPVWAIVIAQYCQSWGMVGLLSWMPSYFAEKYSVPVASLADYTVLPYLVQVFVAVSAGYLADFLISKKIGWRVLVVRQLMQVIGMIIPAALLIACATIPNLPVSQASILITIGSAIGGLTVAGVSCSHFDISPRNAGAIYGIGNTASCIGGALAVPVSGWIHDITHSWEAVFLTFAVHYIGGAIAWMLLASDQPLSFGNNNNDDSSSSNDRAKAREEVL
eukprot:gene7326-14945_t